MIENFPAISVFVAALLSLAVGSIWYSPIMFGPYWLHEQKLTEKDATLSRRSLIKLLGFLFIAHLLFLHVLTKFIGFSTKSGSTVFEFAGLLVVLLGAAMAILTVWERRSFRYFLMNLGYTALVIFGGMTVIAYWPW